MARHLARAGDGQDALIVKRPCQILTAGAALDNVCGESACRQQLKYHQQRKYEAQ